MGEADARRLPRPILARKSTSQFHLTELQIAFMIRDACVKRLELHSFPVFIRG